MATQTVETWQDGVLIETREVEVPDVPSGPLQVMVDPQALADARASIATATTIAALRKATLAALDLLNPASQA
jgi:hypothetical protein